jgi:hypothetical protein
MAGPVTEPSKKPGPSNRTAWPWPDSLDAMIAAPKHHRVLLENEHVRVVDTRIPPGDTVPVHTHRSPGVYYTVVAGDFIRRDPEGNVLFDSRNAPSEASGTNWLEALPPHSVENISPHEIHVVSVELKDC